MTYSCEHWANRAKAEGNPQAARVFAWYAAITHRLHEPAPFDQRHPELKAEFERIREMMTPRQRREATPEPERQPSPYGELWGYGRS